MNGIKCILLGIFFALLGIWNVIAAMHSDCNIFTIMAFVFPVIGLIFALAGCCSNSE